MPASPPTSSALNCQRARAIGPLAAEWDALAPADLPHLRSGFLAAIERSGMLPELEYYLVRRGNGPVGIALAYTLMTDSMAGTPPLVRKLVDAVRKVRPRFMWKPMRVCGSPISNAEEGVVLDGALPDADRRAVFRRLVAEIEAAGGKQPTYFFKEFDQQSVSEYAGELESLGFFANDPWSGTRLDLPGATFDEYLAALKKRYRRRVRQELQSAEKELEFVLLDSFAELAPRAYALYDAVYAHAKSKLAEKANQAFWAAVSECPQARLLVARRRDGGEVLGVNLLLFGESCMHNLYIGFDYALNEKLHIYFNLVIESLRAALAHGCRTVYLGQDSYEFKARLGAQPFPLTAYLRHQIGMVHNLLYKNRAAMFPPNEPVTHAVFQGSGDEAGEPDA